jgi:hypothetical protein
MNLVNYCKIKVNNMRKQLNYVSRNILSMFCKQLKSTGLSLPPTDFQGSKPYESKSAKSSRTVCFHWKITRNPTSSTMQLCLTPPTPHLHGKSPLCKKHYLCCRLLEVDLPKIRGNFQENLVRLFVQQLNPQTIRQKRSRIQRPYGSTKLNFDVQQPSWIRDTTKETDLGQQRPINFIDRG